MDEILTIRDVASRLKMAERTIYAMAADGELPAFKVRGQWRVRLSALEEWLDALSAPGEPRPSPSAVTVDRALPMNVQAEEPNMVPEDNQFPVARLSERVSQRDLHERLLRALGRRVTWSGPAGAKPFELDLGPPLPAKLRVYMYNATRPPGGRPLGEHKVQLIVPGQSRGQRASFDNSGGRMVLLIGYAAEEEVFILWDAGLYSDFAWSRNVQVKAETIIHASAGRLATQFRQLRPGGGGAAVLETVIAAPAEKLAEAIDRRIQLTRDRLSAD